MSANAPDPQSYVDTANMLENNLGVEVPVVQPFRFGPASWNSLFYVTLGISFVFGFLAFTSSGSWSDALLYFLISLIGTTFLSFSFLSFVIIPLFLKHRERVIEARKAAMLAAKAAAIERNEQMVSERHRRIKTAQPSEIDPNDSFVFADQGPSAMQGVAPSATNPTVEDQASSLRRMVGNGK